MNKCVHTDEDAERMTLAEHAEAWWGEQGQTIPPRKSAEWDAMYVRWIEFAFAGQGDVLADILREESEG